MINTVIRRVRWPQGRWGWGIALAAIALLLFLILLAPNHNPYQSGSTYGRGPDGYGAWYAQLQSQGIAIQRWQKPFSALADLAAPQGITLLRVNPIATETLLVAEESRWVAAGNTLIVLGVQQPVTAAPFRSHLDSPVGPVRIETRRRHPRRQAPLAIQETERLGDRFGAIVWQQALGQGQVIFAVTPHLAANAYQNEVGNFSFLTQLVTQTNQPIWVNEYIHRYRDREVQAQEGRDSWVNYLGQTAWKWVALQGSLLLLLLIWAKNHRFGPAVRLSEPDVDNSQAYIEALAGVLQQAGSHGFVLERIGQAEKQRLQNALGLGTEPIAPTALVAAWVAQTGQPATDLEAVLTPLTHPPPKLSEAALQDWLAAWHRIEQQLPTLSQARLRCPNPQPR